MKSIILLLLTATTLLLASCGGGNKKDGAAGTSSSASSSDGGDGKSYTDIIGTNAGEYESTLSKILDKAGSPDAEILEINSDLDAPNQFHKEPTVRYSVQLVNPKDKNKIVQYVYTSSDGKITGPSGIELSQGVGSDEKFVDTYDGFKEHLFKKSDFDMSKMPAIKKDAMERAMKDYGDKCYVEYLNLEREARGNGAVWAYVSVQSTRSITASKSYYYDKTGKLVD